MTNASFAENSTGPQFHEGAQLARALLLNMRRTVEQACSTGSDFDVQALAKQIQLAIGCAQDQRLAGFAVALAAFLGSTLEGFPPSPENWSLVDLLSGR